jgi:hypothetical protein
MLGFVIISVAVIAAFTHTINNRRNHIDEMYASFARGWDESRSRAIAQRDKLLAMDIPADDEEALQLRAEILMRYGEDIVRYTGYVEHFVSFVPPRQRKKLNCPVV